MKLKRNRVWRLYVEGSSRPFLIDLRFALRVRKVRWKYDPKKKRCRGWLTQAKTRQFLHRYILSLARKRYAEASFANGDPHDCRLANIVPYSRVDDGATRRLFKNSTSGRKGVSFHKRKKKWIAAIRVNGRLRHLGYFVSSRDAAAAYAVAWQQAHPNKTLIDYED